MTPSSREFDPILLLSPPPTSPAVQIRRGITRIAVHRTRQVRVGALRRRDVHQLRRERVRCDPPRDGRRAQEQCVPIPFCSFFASRARAPRLIIISLFFFPSHRTHLLEPRTAIVNTMAPRARAQPGSRRHGSTKTASRRSAPARSGSPSRSAAFRPRSRLGSSTGMFIAACFFLTRRFVDIRQTVRKFFFQDARVSGPTVFRGAVARYIRVRRDRRRGRTRFGHAARPWGCRRG